MPFVLLFLLIQVTTLSPLIAAEIHLPPGTNVVDVREHGAKGDGVTDDTAALRESVKIAIERGRYSGMPFVWLPKGTYLVSGPVESRVADTGWASGWRAGMLLCGESRGGTIIKLIDGADGFGDPQKPKALIATGSESDGTDNNPSGGGNRAFRHAVINLTIDVGANPGAVGLDYITNNRGTVEDVTIRAPSGSGWCGLRMERNWPGPALIEGVAIEGFQFGIRTDQYQYGMTFHDLTLSGQRELGWRNTSNVLSVQGLVYHGPAPFFIGTGDGSFLTLLDAVLSGGDGATPAITSKGAVVLRRVTASGFAPLIPQGATLAIGGGDAQPLDLAIEPCPRYEPATKEEWTVVSDEAAFQKAIDANATAIAIASPGFTVSKTIELRGKVKLIRGFNAHLGMAKDNPVSPMVRYTGTGTVIWEHCSFRGQIEHASTGGLALRHVDLGELGASGCYQATAAGRTWIVDAIGKGYEVAKGHRFWGWQVNAEFGKKPLLINRGTMWILGFKSEGEMTCIANEGGDLELLGAMLYPLGQPGPRTPKVPAFTNHGGGRVALTFALNGSNRYPTWYADEAGPVAGPKGKRGYALLSAFSK